MSIGRSPTPSSRKGPGRHTRRGPSKTWVDMRLHESHEEGGFGVSHNMITRHAASYTTNQVCCLPGHLCTPCSAGLAARQRHPGPLHAQALAWGPLAAVRLHRASRIQTPAAVRWRQRSRQRGRTPAASRRLQDHSNGKLLLPQLDRLHLAFKRRQVSPSASSSSQDQQDQQRGPRESRGRLRQVGRTQGEVRKPKWQRRHY